MNDADEFRKALMHQPYIDFLDWATNKDELQKEYRAFIDEAIAQEALNDAMKTFKEWVTEWYWGETE